MTDQLPSPALLFAIGIAAALTACATPQISHRPVDRTDPVALSLLRSSQQAHGAVSFAKVRDIRVTYEGRWAALGPKFQPVLADTKFRRASEERLLLKERLIAQEHTGPGGKKFVLRRPREIRASYNGAPSSIPEVRAAAALVADAYTLFLLGPFYFDRPGVKFVQAGEETIDGLRCDRVIAVLRPGFGEAIEDRVVLSIDRKERRLRRVLMTLNGLASTQAAEVDVTFRDFKKMSGVWWPTDFDERIRVPFKLHAHHWKLRSLEVNLGFQARDLAGPYFTEPR